MGSELVLLVWVRVLLLGMVQPSIVCLVTVAVLDLRCRFPGRDGLHGHSKVGHIVGRELYTSHIEYRPKPVASQEEGRRKEDEEEEKKRRMPMEPRNRRKNQPGIRTSWRCSDNPAATAHTNPSVDTDVLGMFAPDDHPRSNLHSSDRFSLGFFSLRFLFCCLVVDYDTQRKDARGYFWRGPDGDPSDTAVAGGVAVVVCMDGRWRSSRAGRMEGRKREKETGQRECRERERERGSEAKEGRRSEWRKNEQGGIEWGMGGMKMDEDERE